MNTKCWSFNLFVLFLTLLLPVRGFAQRGEDSPLHGEMDGINRNFRQLQRQYADPAQKASSLELVTAMQKHAEKAKTLTPPKADKMTGDEKAKYAATFQKDLDALTKEIVALKDAIANDKADAAKAEVEKIAHLKDSSHKDLGVEMGPPRGGRRGPPQGQPPGPPPGQ
jgi:hypothetical protein